MDDWVRQYGRHRGHILLPGEGRAAFLPFGIFDLYGGDVHGRAGCGVVCGYGRLGESEGGKRRGGEEIVHVISYMPYTNNAIDGYSIYQKETRENSPNEVGLVLRLFDPVSSDAPSAESTGSLPRTLEKLQILR